MAEKKDNRQVIELALNNVNLSESGRYLMRLNKEDLKTLVTPLVDFLKNYEVKNIGTRTTGVEDILKKLSQPDSYNKMYKEEWAILYLSFCSNIHNIFAVAEKDWRIAEAWKIIAEAPEIMANRIERLIGRKITMVFNYFGNFCEPFFYPLILVDNNNYYNYYFSKDTNYAFTLYTTTRELMLKKYVGENVLDPVVVEKLPDKKNLDVENFESYISSDLAYLNGLAMTDSLGSTGKITASRLNAIKKAFKTPEFSYEKHEWGADRIEMLIYAYSKFYLSSRNTLLTTKPESFANFLVKNLANRIEGADFGVFLPEFKSFTRAWTQRNNVHSLVNVILNIVASADKGWLECGNLKLRYLCAYVKGVSNFRYVHLFQSEARRKNTLKRKGDEENQGRQTSSYINNWFEEIDFPFVVNWIKLMCAAGLLEIAFDKNWETLKKDDLEGLRYIRLTPLGRFAFGFDKVYKAPVSNISSDIEIDDLNEIITVLSDTCPYIIFLQQISIPVGGKRFKLTPESIMKNCDNGQSVEMRIENLKRIVDLEKNPGIKNIVEQVYKRLNCADKVANDYIIFKVKPDLPDLIKLLTTDKEIRENIILAEGGVFLVKNNYLLKLQNKCRTHGFILK